MSRGRRDSWLLGRRVLLLGVDETDKGSSR